MDLPLTGTETNTQLHWHRFTEWQLLTLSKCIIFVERNQAQGRPALSKTENTEMNWLVEELNFIFHSNATSHLRLCFRAESALFSDNIDDNYFQYNGIWHMAEAKYWNYELWNKNIIVFFFKFPRFQWPLKNEEPGHEWRCYRKYFLSKKVSAKKEKK